MQCAAPPNLLREPERQKRHDRAADPDAQVREPHRPAARRREPAGQEHLVRERPAAEIPERVEEIKEVKPRERADRPEPDQRGTGHEDPRDHEAARAEAIHQPAGEEPEQRPDEQLRDRVAGGDLGARPPELAHHQVVEERQAVQRDPDDGEQRQERRRRDLDLRIAQGGGRAHKLWRLSSLTA